MNDDAIPEFADAKRMLSDVGREFAAVYNRPSLHHPNCGECCAMGRCHWCLVKPESGTLTASINGFVYSACRAHHRFFAEMQQRASPSAGLDLTAGLAGLSISPLTR